MTAPGRSLPSTHSRKNSRTRIYAGKRGQITAQRAFGQQVGKERQHFGLRRPEIGDQLPETALEAKPQDGPVFVSDVILVKRKERAVAGYARQRADGSAVEQDVEDGNISPSSSSSRLIGRVHRFGVMARWQGVGKSVAQVAKLRE